VQPNDERHEQCAVFGRVVPIGFARRPWHGLGFVRRGQIDGYTDGWFAHNSLTRKFKNIMKNGLHELFLEELADMYSAEQQLMKALPKLAKAAQSDELREAFEAHLEETETHISRLEQAFESLDQTPKKKKCKGIEGILDEGKEMMSGHKKSAELDAALISAAQKSEHYEIASYGCLCTWAEQMGHATALELLKENLGEEKEADEKLTEIAKSIANLEAEHAEV
jgi:ferritin-like metal-binding protein YciE